MVDGTPLNLRTQLQSALAGGGGIGLDRAPAVARGTELGLSPLAGGALNASSLGPGVAPTGAPTGGQVGGGANVSAAPTLSPPGGPQASAAPMAGLQGFGALGGMVGNLPAAQQQRFQTQWQSLDQAAPGEQLDFWSQLLGGGAPGNKRILDAIMARGNLG